MCFTQTKCTCNDQDKHLQLSYYMIHWVQLYGWKKTQTNSCDGQQQEALILAHLELQRWLGTDTNMLQRMQVLLKDVINLEVSDLVALLIRFTHIQEFDIFSFFFRSLRVDVFIDISYSYW